eukprot:7682456-Karenia_brevis.AAC.1
MLEWPALRAAAMQALPRHGAVTCWKHAAISQVEQPKVVPAPKDRGAEQGDVDGPLECSLTLGTVASKVRQQIHEAQRRGELPWASQMVDQQQAAVAEFDNRAAR